MRDCASAFDGSHPYSESAKSDSTETITITIKQGDAEFLEKYGIALAMYAENERWIGSPIANITQACAAELHRIKREKKRVEQWQ